MARPVPKTILDRRSHPQKAPPVSFTYDALESGGASVHALLLGHGIHLRTEEEHFLHPHPAFTRLFLFEKGWSDLVLDGRPAKRLRLAPGRIHLVPQDQTFRVAYSSGSVLFFWHLSVTNRLGMPLFSGTRGIPWLRGAEPLAAALFKARHRDDRLAWHGHLFQALMHFAHLALPAIRQRERKAEPLADLIQHIHTRFGAGCTVERLAQQFHTPRHALSKRFRRTMGVSLKHYLTEVRLQKAKELLATTDASLETIAGILEFEHVPYFYRFFRRAMGMTPGAYRAAQES